MNTSPGNQNQIEKFSEYNNTSIAGYFFLFLAGGAHTRRRPLQDPRRPLRAV